MKSLAMQDLTHEQVYNALHAKGGTREVKFRYDLIRNGVEQAEVDVISASVSLNCFNAINRTARFEIKGNQNINWLSDMIKPYMLVKIPFGKWIEYPLGVFVLSTPTKQTINNENYYEVEAYDKTVILKEDCIIERFFVAKGTKYIDAVENILLTANATDIMADGCDIVLPTDREFEIGTSKLEIINKLLSEINFNPVSVNADGIFILQKYVEPSVNNISYTYKDDELSVIYSDTTSEQDFYNVPNVFIAVVSNPELKQDYKSVYINNNPTSKLSTISRKRNIVSEIYKPDVISSQADLDEYIRKIAFEKSQVFEKLTFTTALMPIHERGEILEIRNNDVQGVYSETSWSMELSAGGEMTHEVRRVISIW